MKVVVSILLITPKLKLSEKRSEMEKSIRMQIYTTFKCPELPVHRTLLKNFVHFNICMFKWAIPTQNVLNLYICCDNINVLWK